MGCESGGCFGWLDAHAAGVGFGCGRVRRGWLRRAGGVVVAVTVVGSVLVLSERAVVAQAAPPVALSSGAVVAQESEESQTPQSSSVGASAEASKTTSGGWWDGSGVLAVAPPAVVEQGWCGSYGGWLGLFAGGPLVTVCDGAVVAQSSEESQTPESPSDGVSAPVDPPQSAPAVAASLEALVVTVGGPVVDVDVTAAFAGIVDTYAATSSDEGTVSVSASGPVVSVKGVATGEATVTVTATNSAGSVSQALVVTVHPSVPVVAREIPRQGLVVGDATTVVDVASSFDGVVDTYRAVSADESVLAVSMAGSQLSLTPLAAGSTTVSVIASNMTGSATQVVEAVVLASGCVESLGTPDGSVVVSHERRWAREDLCLSVHASEDRSRRHYARYFSVTLDEAMHVRIGLSGAERLTDEYLFLLAGAGTAGEVVASDVETRDGATDRAYVELVVEPGVYTIEAASGHLVGGSYEREDDFTLTIDAFPTAPTVPPPGCFEAWGVVVGAEVVSRDGRWSRRDVCLSVHATEDRSRRHYARYFSVTLDEAMHVRIGLSGAQALTDEYLFLLAGEGTTGKVVASDVETRDGATDRAFVELVVEPGVYMIEAASGHRVGNSYEREDDFTLTIDAFPTAPTIPPVHCFRSLGTLGGEMIVAPDGRWSRRDVCRSVHASEDRARRHYARYFSVTLDEAMHVRIGLSGAQALTDEYLFLLAGEGTTGKVVASDVETRDGATDRAFVELVVEPGVYTIEAASGHLVGGSASSIGRCTVPVMMTGANTSTDRWRYQHARRTAGVARARGDFSGAD